MNKIIVFLIFPIIIHSKILSVIEINRIGMRTSRHFKNDLIDKFYGRIMNLTPHGLNQLKNLGESIRKKYIEENNFLKYNYDSEQFKIYSSETQRSIYSSEGFLSGLYPENLISIKYQNDYLNLIQSDTVPFFYDKEFFDNQKLIELNVLNLKKNHIISSGYCLYNGKILDEDIEDNNKEKNFDISNNEINNAINDLSKYLNITLNHFSDISIEHELRLLSDLYFVYKNHFNYQKNNLKTISFNTEIIMKKNMLNYFYPNKGKITENIKIASTGFLKFIFNQFKEEKEEFENNNSKNKFTVFSAHDISIVRLLEILFDKDSLNSYINNSIFNDDYFNILIPEYAYSLIFELNFDDKKNFFYVKIYVNGNLLDVKFNGIENYESENGKIYLDKFLELIENNINESEFDKLDCVNAKSENDIIIYDDI